MLKTRRTAKKLLQDVQSSLRILVDQARSFPVQIFCKPFRSHLTENEELKEENHIIMNCPEWIIFSSIEFVYLGLFSEDENYDNGIEVD